MVQGLPQPKATPYSVLGADRLPRLRCNRYDPMPRLTARRYRERTDVPSALSACVDVLAGILTQIPHAWRQG